MRWRRRQPERGVLLMEERRRREREPVDEIAYIFGDGSSTKCRVINVSEDGAAMEVPDARFIRSRFKLMIEKDRLVRDCRLVWSSGSRIGVAFASVGVASSSVIHGSSDAPLRP